VPWPCIPRSTEKPVRHSRCTRASSRQMVKAIFFEIVRVRLGRHVLDCGGKHCVTGVLHLNLSPGLNSGVSLWKRASSSCPVAGHARSVSWEIGLPRKIRAAQAVRLFHTQSQHVARLAIDWGCLELEAQLHRAPRPSNMVFTVSKKINASRPGDMFLI